MLSIEAPYRVDAILNSFLGWSRAVRPGGHVAAAVPLGALLGWALGDWPAALAGALYSVLIDLDYIPDHIHWRGGWRGVADFLAANQAHGVDRLLLALHSWEWLVPSGLILWALGGWIWALCLCAGWVYHLLWDQAVNPVGPKFYFFFYRMRYGFSRAALEAVGGIRPG